LLALGHDSLVEFILNKKKKPLPEV
jgi:hypothetical protein